MKDADAAARDFRHGLSLLLDSRSQSEEFIQQMVHKSAPLDKHPFGLKLWPTRRVSHPLVVVGSPGGTQSSVEGMKVVLRHILGHFMPQLGYKVRLRIIRGVVNLPPGNEGKKAHHVYFEVGCEGGNYICGGCTDCSGEGGGGRERLEKIFAFVSSLYQVEIEDVTVPAQVQQRGEHQLYDAYDRQRK